MIVILQRYGAHCIAAFSHRDTIFKHTLLLYYNKKTKSIYCGVIIYRQQFVILILAVCWSDNIWVVFYCKTVSFSIKIKSIWLRRIINSSWISDLKFISVVWKHSNYAVVGWSMVEWGSRFLHAIFRTSSLW